MKLTWPLALSIAVALAAYVGARGPIAESTAVHEELPPGHPPVGSASTGRPIDPNEPLPLGHPPIDQGAMREVEAPKDADLTWTAPPAFRSAPNPNSMRIATYRVASAGTAGEGELSVTKAGGSAESNAARWIGQFDHPLPSEIKQSVRTIGALQVSLVEVAGTFTGGGMAGPGAKADWALVGAIVEIGDSSYFFKLTGPRTSVHAAKGDFDKLLATLRSHS